MIKFLKANKLSVWLLLAKSLNFFFITAAIVLTVNDYGIAENLIKAASLSGLLLIIFGPLSHHIAMVQKYTVAMMVNISLILSLLLCSGFLSNQIFVLLAFAVNMMGRTFFDTIFVNHHLVSLRAKVSVATDIVRLTFVVLGWLHPYIFLAPLLIEILILSFMWRAISGGDTSKRFVDLIREVHPGVAWWVLSQRMSSVILLIHLDRLEDSATYAYCILLATQISGLLETVFSTIWFQSISSLKEHGDVYSYALSKVVLIAMFIGCFILILSIFYGPFLINLGKQPLDIAAVGAMTFCIFSARFGTLNINHLALYSQGKSKFNIILIINLILFMLMFLSDSHSWGIYIISFLVTSGCICLYQKRFFHFSRAKV